MTRRYLLRGTVACLLLVWATYSLLAQPAIPAPHKIMVKNLTGFFLLFSTNDHQRDKRVLKKKTQLKIRKKALGTKNTSKFSHLGHHVSAPKLRFNEERRQGEHFANLPSPPADSRQARVCVFCFAPSHALRMRPPPLRPASNNVVNTSSKTNSSPCLDKRTPDTKEGTEILKIGYL